MNTSVTQHLAPALLKTAETHKMFKSDGKAHDNLTKDVLGQILADGVNIKIEADHVENLDQLYQMTRDNVQKSMKKNQTILERFGIDQCWRTLRSDYQVDYHVYVFKVTFGGHIYYLRKNYRDFKNLDRKLDMYGFAEFYHRDHSDVHALNLPSENGDPNYNLHELTKYLNLKKRLISENIDSKQAGVLSHFLSICLESVKQGNKFTILGTIQKKMGSRKSENVVMRFIKQLTGIFEDREMMVTPEGLNYLEMDHTTKRMRPTASINFDGHAWITADPAITQEDLGIIVNTSDRNMLLRCKEHGDYKTGALRMLDWLYNMTLAVLNSPYAQLNRYGSFAPIRANCWSVPYVCGYEYYSDMYDAIENAKVQIMITDWQLNPQIYLKRPIQDYPDSRFDFCIERAAKRGVKVHVLIFREMPSQLSCASEFAEKLLEGLSPNVEVMRHPVILGHFWSHHEKMCCIDQTVLFMGGLDVCFGRYEYPSYHLFDPAFPNKTIYNGQDYYNQRIKDFSNLENFEECQVRENIDPRMPWRDIACQVKGEVVDDAVRHFIQYWNFARDQTKDGREHHSIMTRGQNIEDIGTKAQGDQHMANRSGGQAIGGTGYKVASNLTKGELARQRWRDAIDRVIIQNMERKGSKAVVMKKLMYAIRKMHKKSSHKVVLDQANIIKMNAGNNYQDGVNKNFTSLAVVGDKQGHSGNTASNKSWGISCQFVRSIGDWSYGVAENQTERSIQQAYLNMIHQAEHFIYIENQFFISSTAGKEIHNQITSFLVDKIIQKIKEKKKFRVCIFIPILPGVDGDIMTAGGDMIRIILGFELKTLSRGGSSIMEMVAKHTPNPEQYVRVFGLRNHGVSPITNEPHQEICYIHSKLMIVDDASLIMGSANINDRSMMGERDSEIAMVFQDKNTVPGILDGKPHNYPAYSHNFRKKLFMNTYDLTEAEVADPLNDAMWDKIDRQCELNNDIYRTCFGPYPDNQAPNYSDIPRLKAAADKSKYWQLKDKIRGIACTYPLYFLKNENIDVQKEVNLKLAVAPTIIFT